MTLGAPSSSPSPSPSAWEGRAPAGAVTLPVTLALRDTLAGGLREHRKPDTLPAPVQALRSAWDELVAPHGFTAWGERTSRQLLADALAALERRPLDEWRRVFALVPCSPVCRGELLSRQRASLVYMLRGRTNAGYEPAELLLSGAWSVDPLPPAPEAAPVIEETPVARAWRQVGETLATDGKAGLVEQLTRNVRPVALEDGHLVVECVDFAAEAWLHVDGVLELVRQVLRMLGHAGVRLLRIDVSPKLEATAAPSVPLHVAPVAPPPPARPAREARVPLAAADVGVAAHVAFFAWTQEERLSVYPNAMPQPPPPGWEEWYRQALAAVGGDEGRLRAAWQAYLQDDWARGRKPVCPAVAFIVADVWQRHVPGQDAPAAPAVAPGPALPDTQAGHAWGALLKRVDAAGKPYAAKQLARLRPALDGTMLLLEAPDRVGAKWFDEEYGHLVKAELAGLSDGVKDVRFVAPGGER
ncbi:hypothetical protein D7V97_41945 [Corallococcus sp. CA053C]|uniref:hypothetical protein n=1 Tax=Corallococcus sp. CA053C TaxID=2316732 RepID=UPI000EA2DD06|nr:hypothetical protein [Corallococcus sp. CA053C]RKG91152.1 hypothetical protein D7V97_41945 [Corallococcus sp. CA053C]